MGTFSEREAVDITVTDLGELCENEADAKFYTGNIGIKTEADRQTLEEMRAANLEQVYEKTLPGAPETCIDGSRHQFFSEAILRKRGPQGAGGTPVNAAVHYMVTEKNTTFLRDLVNFSQLYKESGVPFIPGDHNAIHAQGENSGCGGLDGMIPIAGLIIDPKARSAHMSLTRRIMGQQFDRRTYDTQIQRYGHFYSQLPGYLSEGDQKKALEIMQHMNPDADPVEPLTGDHGELKTRVNRVPYTTLFKDLLAAIPTRNGREMRAFGLDAWWYHELPRFTLPGEPALAQEYAHARAAYDAAGLMVLTDGSLGLTAREPKY